MGEIKGWQIKCSQSCDVPPPENFNLDVKTRQSFAKLSRNKAVELL